MAQDELCCLRCPQHRKNPSSLYYTTATINREKSLLFLSFLARNSVASIEKRGQKKKLICLDAINLSYKKEIFFL
jgi:hypothetical protein